LAKVCYIGPPNLLTREVELWQRENSDVGGSKMIINVSSAGVVRRVSFVETKLIVLTISKPIAFALS